MRGNKKTGEFYLHVPTLKQEPDKRGVWCDVLEAIIHVNFALLVEFVEQEECFETVSWDWEPGTVHAGNEIRRLYHWWKVIRPWREKDDPIHWDSIKCPKSIFTPVEGQPHLKEWHRDDSDAQLTKEWNWACSESHRLAEVWYEEDNQAVKDLMDIRGYLWT